MKAVLTDKQSYDTAFMSGLDFFLSLSSPFFLPPECLSQLSVLFPSPWALLTQESVTPHAGESGTCWRPLLFMRQCDPLCHPLSARGVCLHRCPPYSLYQPGVANEKHQVNTTTRTAMALNLLIHLDTANWNPYELHSGHHPFSCKPSLNGKCICDLILFLKLMPELTHLELDNFPFFWICIFYFLANIQPCTW